MSFNGKEKSEEMRRDMVAMINAAPKEREELEQLLSQKVYDTKQLQEHFSVHSFAAPLVLVTRKSDNAMGVMLFQHIPRYYFWFTPDDPVLAEKEVKEKIETLATSNDESKNKKIKDLLAFYELLVENEEESAKHENSEEVQDPVGTWEELIGSLSLGECLTRAMSPAMQEELISSLGENMLTKGESENYEAILWIQGDRCRIMLKHGERVLNVNDQWNNRASAEMTVRIAAPNAAIRFVMDTEEIKQLNTQWDAAKEAFKPY